MVTLSFKRYLNLIFSLKFLTNKIHITGKYRVRNNNNNSNDSRYSNPLLKKTLLYTTNIE